MMEQQRDMRIPSELLPVCPHCGKPLTMNLRSDNKFVEDEGWCAAEDDVALIASTRECTKNGVVVLYSL